MKKHDRPGSKDPDADGKRDEHAYEDSWYRSLKALADSRAAEHDDETDEHQQHDEEPAGNEPVDTDSSTSR